ncbi:MAG: phosphate signaling complex protein PhoU [Lachnospiraceae bacterium]|nr:phosphate signaling complex protein PhoU [Lachnospiraceae bacterium]
MRNRFDDMLDELNVELIKMGALCEDAITTAIKSIQEDETLYEKVVGLENEINEKERAIEAMCMRMLLMQQPVATDLREVSSALKMISDMERIGDQALDIAEMSKYLRHVTVKMEDLEKMAKATAGMVTESIDSFVKHDLELARIVEKRDDEVDDLFYRIKKEIIEMIGANQVDGEYLTDVLMVAKYFERIADHATNIVEWVAYSITGVHEKCQ